MPYGYGSANQSGTSSGRDTGSNYGQFDRAVSRAANNPPASTPSGNGNNKEKATIEAILKAVTTPKAPPSILNPYVPPTDDRVPDQIRDIITPPVTTRDDRDYKQSLVDTTDYKDIGKRGLFNLAVSKTPLLKNINPWVAGWNALSSIFGWGKKVDPYSTLKSKLSNIKTTPKTNIETIERGDGKTGIETIARGDDRQFEQPTVQEAISKGEGLESGKKLLGLSEEETNYFKKLFASRDRKFLQSIFDKGTSKIQSGKATQKEKDVYTLLQQYLVDPKEGIMGVA
tara:strand:+ start:44 stop:898 length:855 start_codon:yes stop_codon:yes gene_type:complete